ncbi:MAG: DUF861 domain-containing protein [Rhodospirillales bacterium]|jgi:uncharacterized cupin superfamily protein|nr:DUF861 domain-containing protein [Rhodospirillales bacterium]
MSQSNAEKKTDAAEIIQVFKPEDVPLASYPPFDKEDVVSGNPNGHLGVVLYRDPERRFSAGVWECPPAKFIDRATGTELSTCISGSATLSHVESGESKLISPGDSFTCEYGETIIWEVHETFRKVYTVYEHDWDPKRFY